MGCSREAARLCSLNAKRILGEAGFFWTEKPAIFLASVSVKANLSLHITEIDLSNRAELRSFQAFDNMTR